MKKKLPSVLKDGLIGAGIGTAVIIPGISGGTIAFIFNAFEKMTGAVRTLFSKSFLRSLLTLLPFIIGIVVSFAILYFPFTSALEYVKFSMVCLFAGLIAGSLPLITVKVNGNKPTFGNVFGLVIGLIISVLIGVFSVIFDFSSSISTLFTEVPFYLYFILIGVGFLAGAAVVIPGISGSLIVLILGFYNSIMNLFKTLFKSETGWTSALLLLCVGVGIILGFVFCSIFINKLLEKHNRGTMFVILGFIFGSLFTIFFNSEMFTWYKGDRFGLLEWILGPCLAIAGFVGAFLLARYALKKEQSNAKN